MKNRKTLIIVAAVAALLLFGCCCATAAFFLLKSDGGSGGKVRYELSSEQEAVAEDFGMPDDFTVMFGEALGEDFDEKGEMPTHRVEYWNYRSTRLQVVFRDGRFIRQQPLEPLPEGEWDYVKLDPTQFAQGMTAQQVVDLIGAMPDEGGAKTDPASGIDLKTVSFGGGQVLATFEGKELAMVVTLPVKPKGAK